MQKTTVNTDYQILSLSGSPKVEKIAAFRDKIQQAAKEHLQLVIDLSDADKLPTISGAIIGDLLTKLIKFNYQIVIVNSDMLGSHFQENYPDSRCIKHADTYDEVERFFQENPVKILVVEDDNVTAKMIAKYLEKRNAQVIRAVSGEEGIMRCQDESPNLVLMDLHLPKMDGLEASKCIREDPNMAGIPIIMLTADAEKDNVEAAVRLHVEGYIKKPFDPKTFFNKILEVLAES